MVLTEEQKKRKREYNIKYKAKNKDKLKEYHKKWREANSEKLKERNKNYYQANIEKERLRKKKWKENNPEKVKESNKKYFQANIEKERLRKKKWEENNPEKRKECSKKYYQANKNKVSEASRKWKENNPEKAHMSNQISSWKQQGLKHDDCKSLYNKYMNTEYCECCGCKLTTGKPRTSTTKCLDHCHITGLFRRVVCHGCNSRLPRQRHGCNSRLPKQPKQHPQIINNININEAITKA